MRAPRPGPVNAGRLQPPAVNCGVLTVDLGQRQTTMAEREMFASSLERPARKRVSLAVSLVAHAAALYFILRAPAAIFIEPQLGALGNQGRSAQVVYLAPPTHEVNLPAPRIELVRKQSKLGEPKPRGGPTSDSR